MYTDFIAPEDNRWSEILQQTSHDFYHLPGYASFAARHEGGRPCAFLAQTGCHAMLVPLLKRELPEGLYPDPGLCDVLTPYGYPGPLLVGNPSGETLLSMLQAYVGSCREDGVVSSFWRLHPLMPLPLGLLNEIGVVVHHGLTVYIDLGQGEGKLWRDMSLNHQRDIKTLKRNGFAVVRNDWRHWPAFIDAYRKTMGRSKAGPYYFFSDGYFVDLKGGFGDRLEFWTALSPDGDFAAAVLFLRENGMVQYHLGATSENYLHRSPTKLLLFEVCLRAMEEGRRVVHLGGGRGGRMDSLFTFKSRFSSTTAPFYTLRSIIMPDAYAGMVEKLGGVIKERDQDTDAFFPAYRRPI